jgi:hypothetical protein
VLHEELKGQVKDEYELRRAACLAHGAPEINPQLLFAKTSLEELKQAAVRVFVLTRIMEKAKMREADVPMMAKVVLTTLLGYCLKARLEIEREKGHDAAAS